MVKVEVEQIVLNLATRSPVVILRSKTGEVLPIVIGFFEATSIGRRVKGYQTPRPLTHDLIVNVVEQLNGELDSVIISGLREGTYYAVLRVRRDGELVEIDSRPSDALAVAVTCSPPLPIYVNEEVLEEVLGDPT